MGEKLICIIFSGFVGFTISFTFNGLIGGLILGVLAIMCIDITKEDE